MSNLIKCFDVVSMVAEEVTKRFALVWEINKEKYRILKQYCESLDALSDEFAGEAFEADVDDIRMTISVKLECKDMTVTSKSHRYYALAQREVSMGFQYSKNGNLTIEFVFPSVWDKVKGGK